MGTKPHDMRYTIGPIREGEHEEPWLFTVRDECTLGCVSDANVSGVHRPGCGLDAVASVRELLVAWQRQQAHDGLVAYCSRLIANRGVAVKAVSGVDPDRVAFEGRAVGFQDLPSVVVELLDGAKRWWVASLVRPVVPTAVWDDSVAPGGMVCVECGVPVESEPCGEHGAYLGEVQVSSSLTVEQAWLWLHGQPEGGGQ